MSLLNSVKPESEAEEKDKKKTLFFEPLQGLNFGLSNVTSREDKSNPVVHLLDFHTGTLVQVYRIDLGNAWKQEVSRKCQ
jgi:hypothetical protein